MQLVHVPPSHSETYLRAHWRSSFAYGQRQLCGTLWSPIKYVVSRTYKDRSLCGSLATSVVNSLDSVTITAY